MSHGADLLIDLAIELHRRVPWQVEVALLVAFVVGAVVLVVVTAAP